MSLLPLTLAFAIILLILVGTLLIFCARSPRMEVARRLLAAGSFKRIIDAEARLSDLAKAIEQAGSIEDCWAVLRAGSAEFGFEGLRLAIDGAVFQQGPTLTAAGFWHLRIPLDHNRYVNFSARSSFSDQTDSTDCLIVGAFAKHIERGLQIWLRTQKTDPIWLQWVVRNTASSEAGKTQPQVASFALVPQVMVE